MIQYCETKQNWREIVIPSPSLIRNDFWDRKFVEQRSDRLGNFSVLWDDKFSIGNRDISPHKHKIFWYTKLSETQKGSSMKWICRVRQNNFDGKSWYPRLLLSLTFFGTRNFLEGRRVPVVNFLVLQDKNVSNESILTPSLLPPPPFSIKFFEGRNFVKHRRVPLRNHSALWDKKFWRRSVAYSF